MFLRFKIIKPRRVPTDGDSESGQNSAPSKTKKLVLGKKFRETGREKLGKMKKNPKKKKNENELGRTDGKFEISRSNSPYPQILVPNGSL